MEPTTAHDPNVVKAEDALRDALGGGQPRGDWAPLARALKNAYVTERGSLVKTIHHAKLPTAAYSQRVTSCPPAATTTTGNAHPRLSSNPQSIEQFWPVESKRLGEEGTVIAAVRISATGCVTDMAIIGFSGSEMLDGAVLKYLESAEFVPAGPEGKPVISEVAMPIVFKLN
jgi:protein TonB